MSSHHYVFVGQPGEFLTASNGAGVPGRDFTDAEFKTFDPEVQDVIKEHLKNNPHPIFEKREGDPPPPKRVRRAHDAESAADQPEPEPAPMPIPTNVVLQDPAPAKAAVPAKTAE